LTLWINNAFLEYISHICNKFHDKKLNNPYHKLKATWNIIGALYITYIFFFFFQLKKKKIFFEDYITLKNGEMLKLLFYLIIKKRKKKKKKN